MARPHYCRLNQLNLCLCWLPSVFVRQDSELGLAVSTSEDTAIPIYAVLWCFVAVCCRMGFMAGRALVPEMDLDGVAVAVCLYVEINLEFLCHRLALATAATLPNLAGAL